LLGVQDKTVLDDLAKQSDQERQWAAELRQRNEFAAGDQQRKATLEQTRESTTATRENQRRQAAREAASKEDLALYGKAREPVFRQGPSGTIVMHVPGDVDENGAPKWVQRPMESVRDSMFRAGLGDPRAEAEAAAGETGVGGQAGALPILPQMQKYAAGGETGAAGGGQAAGKPPAPKGLQTFDTLEQAKAAEKTLAKGAKIAVWDAQQNMWRTMTMR